MLLVIKINIQSSENKQTTTVYTHAHTKPDGSHEHPIDQKKPDTKLYIY